MILCFYLSRPSRPCCGLNGGDSAVAPLGGGHSNCPGQVLLVVSGGGKYELSYSCLARTGVLDAGALLRHGPHQRGS